MCSWFWPKLIRAARGGYPLWSGRGQMCISRWPEPAVRFAMPRDRCTLRSGQSQMCATMAAARCAFDSGLCRVCALQLPGPSVPLAASSACYVFRSRRARCVRCKGQSWRCVPGLDVRCPMATAGCVVECRRRRRACSPELARQRGGQGRARNRRWPGVDACPATAGCSLNGVGS